MGLRLAETAPQEHNELLDLIDLEKPLLRPPHSNMTGPDERFFTAGVLHSFLSPCVTS